jgi:hypothetical protein
MPDQALGPDDFEKQVGISASAMGPDDFEKSLGRIPAPPEKAAVRPGTWNPKQDTLENISNQLEDIYGQVGRNLGGLGTSVVQKGKDVYRLLQHPSTLFTQSAQTPEEQQVPLKDLPIVGPLSEGRYGAAVGDVATGALLGAAGRMIPGEVGGLRPGETAPFTPKATLPELLNPRTTAETNFLQASKPLAEIINSPKGPGRFQDETLRAAMPILQKEAKNYSDVGKIDNFDKLKALTDAAYEKHVAQYHQYLDPAVARGAVIDRAAEGVPQAMIAAIPKNIQIDSPAVYQELVEEAQSHGTPVKVGDLDQVRMDNNAMLRKFENATGADKASILRAQGSTAMLKAEQAASRDALYRKLDPETGGKNVAEVNRRLGSLIETRNGLTDLNDRMIRQSDPNAIQKVAQNIKDLLHIGASPTTGVASVALRRMMAEPDVNGKIAQAFKSYKGEDLPDVPAPGWNLVSPEDQQSIIRQRGLNEQQLPSSRMDTDFRQQYQDLPVHQLLLKGSPKEEPYPTQRKLFTEGRVNPKVHKPSPSSGGNSSGTPPPLDKEAPFQHGPF